MRVGRLPLLMSWRGGRRPMRRYRRNIAMPRPRGRGVRRRWGGAGPDVCERLGHYLVRFPGIDDDAIGECVHAAAVTLLELAQCRRVAARHPPEQGEIRYRAIVVGHRPSVLAIEECRPPSEVTRCAASCSRVGRYQPCPG